MISLQYSFTLTILVHSLQFISNDLDSFRLPGSQGEESADEEAEADHRGESVRGRPKAGPPGLLSEVVHDVDLPAHVGGGVAVVIDHVGPRDIGGHLS